MSSTDRGHDVVDNGTAPWHTKQQQEFKQWLTNTNLSYDDLNLSLGYLPLGRVDLEMSFGTSDMFKIWDILSNYLDVYKITVDDVTQTFDYCWTDLDYKQQQIDMMKPGYDYSSRRG